MSDPTPAAAVTPAKPRRRRWRKAVLAILGLCTVALAAAYVRGNWADTEPRNPTSSAEGVICRLYHPPDAGKQVRCAVILDQPPEVVWKVVTEYEHFSEVFPTVREAVAEPLPDGSQVTFTLDTPFGVIPVKIHVHHEKTPDKYLSWWDEHGDRLHFNKGSWTLTPAGPGKTLLVYALEVQFGHYPGFLTRNVLLSRQPKVVEAVREYVAKIPKAPQP